MSDAGIPLPPIHLDDFSVGGKPTPLSDVVSVLVGAIASEISKSATSLPSEVLSGLGRAGESAAQSIAGELEKGLGSIFDKLRGVKK